MNITPLAYADSLRIGTIDFVSPDEIKVLLDIDAPNAMALNTGSPRSFPRINSYILISNDDGYLVGQVEWITVERSQYPKRKGLQDFGLIDLPFLLRKMSINPLGTLVDNGSGGEDEENYSFHRGIDAFPSVGDSVLLPTQKQLRSIVESGKHRRVKIGTSTLAGNADVKIDPNRLFGRHLAVLGNTGSGKSCSVAGLIRWSLDAAKKELGDDVDPNARFIVLDPNGEYSRAFKDHKNVRIFAVEADDEKAVKQLKVPMWLWNSAEWGAFTQASGKTQRPLLIQSLRTVRDGSVEAVVSSSHQMRRFLRTLVSIIQLEKNAGSPWGKFPHPKNFFEKIKIWNKGLSNDDSFSADETSALSALSAKIDIFENARAAQHPIYDFTKIEIDEFLILAKSAHSAFGGGDQDILPLDPDVPRKFTGDSFLRSLEANAELMNISEYAETMLMRIRTMLSDSRMKTLASKDSDITLDDWLKDYIGDNKASNGTVTIIDLSLVPAEVIHLVTSVIGRMTLESLQRYRKLHPKRMALPTVMVMEEAHTFVKRYKEDAENQTASAICCQVFEKIAREGRKFGLGLVLSSQRPSELSQTVLSQCNSFLLHRISNDKDQELVQKLVPDNLKGLLRDLPSLPSQNAILLGWASELPVLVKMNHLPKEQQPQSDDPDFWEVWTKSEERGVNWKEISDDWQQINNTDLGSSGLDGIGDN